MAIEAIEHYLNRILAPILKDYGVSESFVKQIIDTVEMQIYSCIRHWTDLSFRRALLLIGSEEGPFYEPAGKNDIKCFVVVTIRNSPFETLQSRNYAQSGLSSELPDSKIQAITKKAISYFNQLNFADLSEAAKQDDRHFDIYGELARRFPVAWTALEQLAGAAKKTIEYAKEPFERPFALDGVPLTDIDHADIDDRKKFEAVLDGYSPDIDPQLSVALYNAVTYHVPFAVDCFKMVTRNIEKLLQIMEFLLTHDRALVTSNYYIENGYAEQRVKPLRAAACRNGLGDMLKHYSQTAGLGYRHAAALKNVYLELKANTEQ